MKSSLPKVLHPLQNKPLIYHAIENLIQVPIYHIYIILGYKKEEVLEKLKQFSFPPNIFWYPVIQEPQLGTAHALLCAEEKVNPSLSWLVVTLGDMPLILPSTYQKALKKAQEEDVDLLLLSTLMPNPTGYGRVIRDQKGNLVGIREEKDATPEEKKIQEVNTGIFILKNTSYLWSSLKKISNKNAQKEYYLPDLIPIYLKEGRKVDILLQEDYREFQGINSPEDLEHLERCLTAS